MLALLFLTGGQGLAAPAAFVADLNLETSPLRLSGHLRLALQMATPAYRVAVTLTGQGRPLTLPQIDYWPPGAVREFDFTLDSAHPLPGRYHLLAAIDYQEADGAWRSTVLGAAYLVQSEPPAGAAPRVELRGQRLTWQLHEIPATAVSLTPTTAPSWSLKRVPLVPPATELSATAHSGRAPLPNQIYPQLARLDWSHRGYHYSELIPWEITTDTAGAWAENPASAHHPLPWRDVRWLYAACAAFALAALLHRRLPRPATRLPASLARNLRNAGYALLLVLLVLWLLAHTHPSLWLMETWPTGGDTASHVYYAQAFARLLADGQLSGWLPESFAGFPAFTHYFPLPFVLFALLAQLLPPPVAFKLVMMAPALLLPVATYLMGRGLRWPQAACVLGAAGSGAFVLTDATAIWGGNLLAQMAGEFAYGWSLVLTACFWGALGVALRLGGRYWLIAAVLEAAVALSHGYGLLVAGFGAMLLPLTRGRPWQDLRLILQVHALAFLLIGFWLIPLIGNLPWTIANDNTMPVEKWQMLWPRSIWPFALGLVALPAALVLAPRSRPALTPLFCIVAVGLAGFFLASYLNLADIRFYPFAQWACAVAAGAGIGWAIAHSTHAPLLWSMAAVIGLLGWWEPGTEKAEHWSRLSLEGFESKPAWPAYQKLGALLQGPLRASRISAEFTPENLDLGSERALEALPMLGTRPVLEGLYMESAISSPFIYQIQAEVSLEPSSPLARYPSVPASIDQAVEHMNEFYADTLIVRSDAMKERLGADPRFATIGSAGPFQVLRLKELQSNLVEPISTPLVVASQADWKEQSFRRFRLDHPYRERLVFLAADQRLPSDTPPAGAARVVVTHMSRERLVFETSAVGRPHLIRMSYHPRWRSNSGEPIFLTEPSFMLIVPQQPLVELNFVPGGAKHLGIALTALGIILGALALRLPRLGRLPALAARPAGYAFPVALTTLGMVTVLGWWHDPERIFRLGQRAVNAQQFAQGADYLDQAYPRRHHRARQAEALFWAGRSHELNGNIEAAMERYAVVIQQHPENVWTPQAMYRLAAIRLQQGERAAGADVGRRLQSLYPGNPWALRAEQLLRGQDPRWSP